MDIRGIFATIRKLCINLETINSSGSWACFWGEMVISDTVRPWKSKNPSYGSQVTAISHKIKCTPPCHDESKQFSCGGWFRLTQMLLKSKDFVGSSWQISNTQNNCCEPLQITPCRIGLPWPYVVGFSAQLYDGMYKCHQLTYNALSDPHSHWFQWFPRLGGPRGKHPWLTKEKVFSQTGLK